MDYRKLAFKDIFDLWELQKRYKAEIGEDEPDEGGRIALADAIAHHRILFFGASMSVVGTADRRAFVYG